MTPTRDGDGKKTADTKSAGKKTAAKKAAGKKTAAKKAAGKKTAGKKVSANRAASKKAPTTRVHEDAAVDDEAWREATGTTTLAWMGGRTGKPRPARFCPLCGSRLIPLIFGLVADPDLIAAWHGGEVAFGGCTPDFFFNAGWQCKGRGRHEFRQQNALGELI